MEMYARARGAHANEIMKKRSNRHCVDCGVCTIKLQEYYMVRHELWAQAGMDRNGGMLCINCLEHRLGRTLIASDFLDVPLNKADQISMGGRVWKMSRSDRLRSRLAKDQGA
jgi:hypothetical protein